MRKQDNFQKNHLLGIEFDRYLLEHPDILEKIPENADIYFLPDDDPDLREENYRIAENQKAAGRVTVLVRMGRIIPPRSRLEDVRVESLSS